MKRMKLLSLGAALAAVVFLGACSGAAPQPSAQDDAKAVSDAVARQLAHQYAVPGIDPLAYKAPDRKRDDGSRDWTIDQTGPVTGGLPQISGNFRALSESHKARWIYPVSQPWMDSGSRLEKGKTYWIHIGGLAGTALSKSYLWLGPEGTDPGYENEKDNPEPRLPRYAMIGKLGLKGVPFWIGSSLEITPTATETLFLGYTDDEYTDNRGYYVVDVFKATKAQALAELKKQGVSFESFLGD